MKLKYFSETDSVYVELKPNSTAVDTLEIVDGLNVDLDAQEQVIGLDIDRASKFVDLSRLETENLPLKSTKIG